jgi:hypothetical protein
MKKTIFSLLTVLMMSTGTFSQVSITTDGSQPDPSAVLDLKSNSKGFLPPRLTTQQIWQLQNPAAGLVVFNTETGKLTVFDGTNWHELTQGNCVPQPTGATAGPDQLVTTGTTAQLQANTPILGNGVWTIVSGAGTFSDSTNPAAQFHGSTLAYNTLRWSISTNCATNQDDVMVTFS